MRSLLALGLLIAVCASASAAAAHSKPRHHHGYSGYGSYSRYGGRSPYDSYGSYRGGFGGGYGGGSLAAAVSAATIRRNGAGSPTDSLCPPAAHVAGGVWLGNERGLEERSRNSSTPSTRKRPTHLATVFAVVLN